MKLLNIITALMLLPMLITGCKSSRDHVYLQDMTPGINYPMNQRPEPTVQPDDRLQIRVTCKIPELAIPFNITGDETSQGYLVSQNGDIQMPILGTIHVAGKTLEGVQDEVRQKLVAGDYIKDPIVTASFLNFRYTVLGAVGNNGQYVVDGDRVTLIEAIAKAGDLTNDAKTDRVAVIREEADGRKMYIHDLKSTDIFSSPCFYLQQNDIVYVEPKEKKDEKSENRSWQIATVAISAASVISTIVWATK